MSVVALSLIASACGGGSSNTSEPTSTTAAANGNDEQVLSGDDGSDDSAVSVTGIWVPSALAMVEFVEFELAEDNIRLDVIEGEANYDAIEADATAALEDGLAVLVPSTIGARLVSEGATTHARLFESDDPEAAASQLGLWLVAQPSVADGAATSSFEADVQTVAADLGQATNTNADIDVAGEVLTIAGEELDAVADSYVQTKKFEAGAAVVREIANKYGTRAGASVGARTVAKAAGPVGAVLDFMYTMYQFEEAASEMIEAESNARIAAYDTGMTAVAMLSDAHRRLCALEAPVISGDIEPKDSQELVDRMFSSARTAVRVGNASATDLENLGDADAAAQIRQLIEARDATVQAKIAELTSLIAERGARPAQVFVSDTVTSILDPILDAESRDRAIAGALDKIFSDPEPGNESMHSNGTLRVISAGETDIIRHGQFWYAPGIGGPGLDELFPCGASKNTTTLCDGPPSDATNYTVVLTSFGSSIAQGPTDRIYQYGVVFDRDGVESGNYRARPPFRYDTYDNTDLWVEVTGGPDGLGLNILDATDFSKVPTGGRVVVRGAAIAVFIPQTIFPSSPYSPAVPYRSTAFWHLGDFGIDPPHEFNIDASPIVHQPLAMPSEIVKLNGPGTSSGIDFDRGPMTRLYDAIGGGLAGFSAEPMSPDDPSALADTPECWAAHHFRDDPTELGTMQSDYTYNGALISIQVTTHDSESAARGGARFRHSHTNGICRDALISGVIGSDAITNTTRFANDHGSVIVSGFEANGTAFESTSGAFHHGPHTVRYSVVGAGDTSMVSDHVLDAVNDAFATAP